MTQILILEGNSPDMLAAGKSDAEPFVSTILALDPTVTVTIAAPYAHAVTEDQLAHADGVIFTGSGVDWATDAPEAAPQRDAMEQVFATGKPVWGSCNGMQLAAVVLGGAVGASPNGIEIGLARGITLTEVGAIHPAMAGRVQGFAVPCIHRDEVQRLPKGAVLLAGNDHSPVQAIAYETGGVDFWGAQYHPEFSPDFVAQMVRNKPAALGGEPLATALEGCETDLGAAGGLGATPDMMRLPFRAVEIANWLRHVEARKA
ncbi:type 1 glutamine amidotransferase [Shimia biformata]|uniref:type 1 glutamine amidotransferase n=1 Tax=Shimia biformata TaxID=1294299 RepID=UPI00194F4431|nr:type 1 glutamine amidotransferase [Shimia biformata]